MVFPLFWIFECKHENASVSGVKWSVYRVLGKKFVYLLVRVAWVSCLSRSPIWVFWLIGSECFIFTSLRSKYLGRSIKEYASWIMAFIGGPTCRLSTYILSNMHLMEDKFCWNQRSLSSLEKLFSLAIPTDDNYFLSNTYGFQMQLFLFLPPNLWTILSI